MRIAALTGLVGLLTIAAVESSGWLRAGALVLAASAVPGLLQASRGRVGIWEGVTRWIDRFRNGNKCVAGRDATIQWNVGGPLIAAISARPLGPVFHCIVEGPAGKYEAWVSMPQLSKAAAAKFPDDFHYSNRQPAPSLDGLPTGLYFQYWWSYSHSGAMPEFVGQMAFGLTRSGRTRPYFSERWWNKRVRCSSRL